MDEVTFVWLEVTGKCQLRCTHCYAESGPSGTHGMMGAADWLRVIDQAVGLGVKMVQFIGGEPTLYPWLKLLVEHALRQGLSVEIFSNLVHITDDLWEVFSQPGISLATCQPKCSPRCSPTCNPISCKPNACWPPFR